MQLTYIGTKIVKAEPMTRAEWCAFRSWPLPANENGEDPGYQVEYLDGGKPNIEGREGYVSWSPKEQFEKAHIVTHIPENFAYMPAHQQRVIVEFAELDTRLSRLRAFLAAPYFKNLDPAEQARLSKQADIMAQLADVLALRIAAF